MFKNTFYFLNFKLIRYCVVNKSYSKLNSHKIMTEDEANIILENQLMLLRRRDHGFHRVTLEKLKNYSF